MTDPETLTAFLDRLADVASDSIMPHFRARPEVEDKGAGDFDPVTAADRAAETAIRRLITETYPDHGIVGEEFAHERPDAEYVWVIDPIDGTRAFITGLPVWGTLIGLTQNGSPILGMMAQPFTGERYAGNGRTAWYSKTGTSRALAARACPALDRAALFTTTPAMFTGNDRQAYEHVEKSVQLARYGVDCYAYCMVAAGHADIVIEAGLHPYDIVALIPIVTGAGGRVTDWQGNDAAAGGRIVATGDPRLHDVVLKELSAAG